ncbi:MAG: transglutaminase domain-containing protein [Lachnospiraceae bacterium]|nr:transglutaminase domain-containing protein [Lachnospiraceae bacterium]
MMKKVSLFGVEENMIYRVFYVWLLTVGTLSVCADRGWGPGLSGPAFVFIVAVTLLLACLNYLQVRGKVIVGFLSAGLLILGLHRIPEGELGDNIYVRLLLLCAAIYLGEILLEKALVLKLIVGLGILIYLLVCLFGEYEVSHASAILLMWTFMLYLIEVAEHFWKKHKEHPYQNYVVWLMPFSVIYLVMALLTPAPEKPYDWQFVKDAYRNISQAVTTWLEDMRRDGQEDFGRAVAGFSEDGRLMSSLAHGNQEILRLQGNRGLKTNVYLMGKVYDTFSGNDWTCQYSDLYQDRFVDTMESLYYLEGYDSEFQEDYFAGTKLTVEYLYFNTGYLFAPLKTYKVVDAEYSFDGPNLRFNEQVGYSTRYSTYYYQLNINHPSFYAFVHSAKEESEDRWNQVTGDYTPKGERKVTYEELLQRREDIKNFYLPETKVSVEVQAYLDEILADADTDVEKLIAIEEALQRLEYTMTPGALPEWVQDEADFMDYFLLENKKGYCAYFATAFVLLARVEGIPARYVEGFSVPINSDKKVTVYSDMAHAWPEVYLEGVGWIPFEPTPGYAEIRYTPWEPQSEIAQNITSVELDAEEEAEPENVFFVVSTIGVILGCVALFLWMDNALRKRRFKRMSKEERFEYVAMNNLWLLSKLGIQRLPEETLEELQRKFEMTYEFIVILENLRYGDKEIGEQDIILALKEQEDIFKLLKEWNIWLYYLAKIRA